MVSAIQPVLLSLMLHNSLSLDCTWGGNYPGDRTFGEKDDPDNRKALQDLAEAMDYKSWISNKGWMDMFSFCGWESVCCEKHSSGNVVTELHLERNQLKGSFPESFKKLTRLKVLNVHLNSITNFPPDIGSMTDLRQAKFGRNPICGQVPAEFGNLKQLQKFNCNFCCLHGQFPDIFDGMNQLHETFWDGNNFTGTIPTSIGTLKNLTATSWNLNSLTGSVPAGLCDLPSLDDCRIGSDTDFSPYDTSKGSPEKKWLLKWTGNMYSCPLAPCASHGVCNNPKDTPVSPVKCHNTSSTGL